MYPSKTFIPNTFIYVPSSPAFAFAEATRSKHKRNKGFSWLSPSCRTDQSAMASSPSSDSSHGRSVAPPHRLSKDVPGSDDPIPLSPQWLLSKPGESKPEAVSGVKITQGRPAELENRSNSLEIKESSPKIPKLHENCIHGVSQFPTSLFRVKKLSEKAVLPSRASALSAGYDLSSAAKTKVPARGKALIPTDLSIAIPQGTYARIAPRSGLAWKHSIDVGAGVIDADYRGPVGVILFNHSNIDFEVNVGDRVAQLIIEKIMTPDVIEVQDLDATPRGDGGFGSTGV